MEKTNITDDDANHLLEDLGVANAITELSIRVHAANRDVGWWDGTEILPDYRPSGTQAVPLTYVIPTKLCLVHSEISEGLEGFRKDLMDDHLPHRPMLEVELADAVIRILDIAGALEYDLGGAIKEKLAYNAQRADHKREARSAPGGKSI